MYDSYYELYTGASLARMDALLQGHPCTHLSKQKPSPLQNSLLIALKGSIWGALIEQPPHWGALNAPRIHTAHFSHETHMWLILLSREGHRIYAMKLCRLLVLYKLDSLEELLTSCLKFRNVNQAIFWHIYRENFSLLVCFFAEAHLELEMIVLSQWQRRNGVMNHGLCSVCAPKPTLLLGYATVSGAKYSRWYYWPEICEILVYHHPLIQILIVGKIAQCLPAWAESSLSQDWIFASNPAKWEASSSEHLHLIFQNYEH